MKGFTSMSGRCAWHYAFHARHLTCRQHAIIECQRMQGQGLRCMRQALTGAVLTVETLDGRTLSIPSPGVLAAGAVLRVADEGIAGKVRYPYIHVFEWTPQAQANRHHDIHCVWGWAPRAVQLSPSVLIRSS